MRIDWKTRFRNKATFVALLSCLVAFVYQLCGIVGVIPPISESDVSQIVGLVVNTLVFIGVLVDPNTDGLSD